MVLVLSNLSGTVSNQLLSILHTKRRFFDEGEIASRQISSATKCALIALKNSQLIPRLQNFSTYCGVAFKSTASDKTFASGALFAARCFPLKHQRNFPVQRKHEKAFKQSGTDREILPTCTEAKMVSSEFATQSLVLHNGPRPR